MARLKRTRPAHHGLSIIESAEAKTVELFEMAEHSGDEYDHGYADGMAHACALFRNPYRKDDQSWITEITNRLRDAALTRIATTTPKRKKIKRG